MCDKISYDTYAEAEKILHFIRKRKGGKNTHPSRIYKCKVCGKYFLTSTRKRGNK